MTGNSSSGTNTNAAEKTAVEEHDATEYEPLSSGNYAHYVLRYQCKD